MKFFNLQEALSNPERVITRTGRKVTELHYFTTANNSHPLAAVIDGYLLSFTKEGKHIAKNQNNEFDLFLLPIKHQGYINIYSMKGKLVTSTIFNSEREAKNEAAVCVIATGKVEWEE